MVNLYTFYAFTQYGGYWSWALQCFCVVMKPVFPMHIHYCYCYYNFLSSNNSC